MRGGGGEGSLLVRGALQAAGHLYGLGLHQPSAATEEATMQKMLCCPVTSLEGHQLIHVGCDICCLESSCLTYKANASVTHVVQFGDWCKHMGNIDVYANATLIVTYAQKLAHQPSANERSSMY